MIENLACIWEQFLYIWKKRAGSRHETAASRNLAWVVLFVSDNLWWAKWAWNKSLWMKGNIFCFWPHYTKCFILAMWFSVDLTQPRAKVRVCLGGWPSHQTPKRGLVWTSIGKFVIVTPQQNCQVTDFTPHPWATRREEALKSPHWNDFLHPLFACRKWK